MDTLKQLMDYLTHFKLTMAIDRNLHLLQTMKNPKPGARSPKPEEFVRVFDILLQVSLVCFFLYPIARVSPSFQHVTDLGDILGAEDLTSQKYIAALTLAFKSFRCYYLSESYVVMRKWAEAVGLLDRALEHVTQSLEQYRSLEQGTTAVNVKIDQEKVSSGIDPARLTLLTLVISFTGLAVKIAKPLSLLRGGGGGGGRDEGG